ncbi:Eaa1 [Klebsiella quasipneumoniae]|nr:Eaa1 [Klebsiella quasipneumoniae]
MTKSTITRERLEKIKSWRETYGAGSNVMLPAEEAEELASIALAEMESDPVALQPELAKVIYHFRDWNEGFPVERFKTDYVISWMLANYPPAYPAKDREQVRREHAEWSQATFGNVGPIGPLKHLVKEAMEAAAEPDDLSEWADMQFLLWDAQRRAGITDEQITHAMIEKLAVNKQREWPEPKDGEPRLHIKDQPSAVGPVTDAMAYAFHHALTDGPLGDDDVEDIKIGLRAAFANVTTYQPLPVLKEHQIRELVNKLRDIAIEYHSTQQLREHIASVVRAAMIAVAQTAPKSEVN